MKTNSGQDRLSQLNCVAFELKWRMVFIGEWTCNYKKYQPTSSRHYSEAFSISGTFEDGHVDDSANLRHLMRGRGCLRLWVVAAPPAESGGRSGGGGDAANQREQQKQPQTNCHHGCHNLGVEWNRKKRKWKVMFLAIYPYEVIRKEDLWHLWIDLTLKTHHIMGSSLLSLAEDFLKIQQARFKLNTVKPSTQNHPVWGQFCCLAVYFFHIPVDSWPSVKIFPWQYKTKQ